MSETLERNVFHWSAPQPMRKAGVVNDAPVADVKAVNGRRLGIAGRTNGSVLSKAIVGGLHLRCAAHEHRVAG